VDHLELPDTDKGKYLFVAVEGFTKWIEAVIVPDLSAATTAQALWDTVFSRFGIPTSLHSDRHGSFLSNLMTELMKMLEVRQLTNSTHASRSTGMVERNNRTIIDKLRIALSAEKDWSQTLSTVLYSMRASISLNSTGFSPFSMMTGREMRVPADIDTTPHLVSLTARDYFEQLLPRLEILKQVGHENVLLKQTKYAEAYNDLHKVKSKRFTEGEKVLLRRLQIAAGSTRKLQSKYMPDTYLVKYRLGPETAPTYIIENMRTGVQYPSPITGDKLKLFRDRRVEFYRSVGGGQLPQIVAEPEESDSDEEPQQLQQRFARADPLQLRELEQEETAVNDRNDVTEDVNERSDYLKRTETRDDTDALARADYTVLHDGSNNDNNNRMAEYKSNNKKQVSTDDETQARTAVQENNTGENTLRRSTRIQQKRTQNKNSEDRDAFDSAAFGTADSMLPGWFTADD